MVNSHLWLASSFGAWFFATGVVADGTGLIGYGKTLYNPTCTFACRQVIRKQTLSCTPSSSTENHGTSHNPVSTPPKCFVKDPAFLKTMALCIDVYCKLSDQPPMNLIEDYWASHLGTGTLGNYQYVPTMSYQDALAAARQDENEAKASSNTTSAKKETVPSGLQPYDVSSPLGITAGGSGALNRTRLVSPVQWQLQYNYLSDFEINEKGHSTMTITIAVVAMTLPILLSLPRFIPGLTRSHGWSHIKSILVYPTTFGRHHREPVIVGMVPTRGQSLYIFLISFLNIILLIAPYTYKQPQASFTTRDKQTLSIVGNRAGTMAMGNVVALVTFSSRNSILFYLTDWSYSTYLLLHRWLGYWAVLHTIIHSAMLWRYYVLAGSYSAELARLYWIWGIVGTVAVCAIIPFSVLQIRQKLYEFFLASHIALSLLFLIGYYYHIWYVYTYNWGYEIWMFVVAGIWALERLLRIGRMAIGGSHTAVVSITSNTDDEYLRIEVEGKNLKDGVAYLCFPTLGWRFWETHPFSVSGASKYSPQSIETASDSRSSQEANSTDEKGPTTSSAHVQSAQSSAHDTSTVFFARARSGFTKLLREKAVGSEGKQVRLRVLIEGPYNHSGHVRSQLAHCSSILVIAGGVGITACLPIIKDNAAKDTNLFWSSRKGGLVADLEPTISSFPSNVMVRTLVGERFDLDAIIYEKMVEHGGVSKGLLGIVVSGPPGMADDVRFKVTQIARNSDYTRPYVLVDEAFSW